MAQIRSRFESAPTSRASGRYRMRLTPTLTSSFAQHEQRIAHWCSVLSLDRPEESEQGRGLRWRTRSRPWWFRFVLIPILWIGPLPILVAVLIPRALPPAVYVISAALAVFSILFILVYRLSRGFNPALPQRGQEPWRVRALCNRICPQCEYDLSESPDALSPGALDGWRVGPRRCSECNAIWPLVPS